MPTYIPKETEGTLAATARMPVSGKDEGGNARAIPTLTSAEVVVTPSTQPVVPVLVVDSNSKYTHEVALSVSVPLSRGELVKGDIHPHVLTEHMEGGGVQLAALTTVGNTDVGQVFRASKANVESIKIRLSVSGAGVGEWTEDFESYADTAALQAVWSASNTTDTPAVLSTTVVRSGLQSMAITITKDSSLGDTVTKTFASEDWSSLTTFAFAARMEVQVDKITDVEATIRIGDGTNSKSVVVNTSTAAVWFDKAIPFSSFTEDGGGTTNMATITTVEWEITNDGRDAVFYVDDMGVEADPGTLSVELREVASATPTTFGALVASASVSLVNGSDNTYTAELGGAAVIVGNYYIVVASNISNPAVTVGILGESSDYYSSGVAFTSADNGTTMTLLTGQDAMFEVWCRVAGLITTERVEFDGAPEEALINVFAENETTETISRYFVHDLRPQQTTYEFKLASYLIPLGEKVEFHVSANSKTQASHAVFIITFKHEPVSTNG